MIPTSNFNSNSRGFTRRKFIYNTAALAGAGLALASPIVSMATGLGNDSSTKTDGTYTVKQIMDLFINDVPGGVLPGTVDTLKAGSPETVVTGVITTMFATIPVIRNAINLGYNFIIAHEPTFYNHADETTALENDDVYKYKADLLKQHNITVWRNHDYIHRLVPDGVTNGVLAQLDWQKYADKTVPNIITLPPSYLKEVIGHAKTKLNIEKVRFIGDLNEVCKRVLLMPGSAGGKRQIEAIGRVKPDVILCGEISEWETAEYVRDARAKGNKLSLVVLGHIASEEPGSEFMLKWLKEKVPGVKATHIPCGNSLQFA